MAGRELTAAVPGVDKECGVSGRLSRRSFVGLVGAAAIMPRPATDTAGTTPTVIYHNGVVVTMEDRLPWAEAVAIRNGRILAVGADRPVLALKKRTTQVIDLGGRTVMPGFIDSHAHWIGDAPSSVTVRSRR